MNPEKVEIETSHISEQQTNEIIHLNVAGVTKVSVNRALLCSVPNSLLAAMFSGKY